MFKFLKQNEDNKIHNVFEIFWKKWKVFFWRGSNVSNQNKNKIFQEITIRKNPVKKKVFNKKSSFSEILRRQSFFIFWGGVSKRKWIFCETKFQVL